MKKTRKLIPAIVMLLVSAVMMSTASFAWFSMNKDVNVSGMQVQATTSKNLVIKTTGDYASSATLTDSQESALTPVSMNVATNAVLDTTKFFTLDNSQGVDYTTGAYGADTTFKAVSAADGYYEKFETKIKVSTSESAADKKFDNLYVSNIAITGNNASTISPSLRVAITNGTKTFVYAPVGTHTAEKSIASINAAGKPLDDSSATTCVDQHIATYTTTDSFGEINTTEQTFTIYIWFEGNDASCNSVNAVNVDELTVQVYFAAV